MHIANQVLGNIHADESLSMEVQRLDKQKKVERVFVPFHDAGRRRVRLRTDQGTDIGVDLPMDEALQNGDVLAIGDESDRMVLIEVAPSEAMALRMSKEIPADQLFECGVRLGHMLGNQHWPITVKDDVVYAPLTIDHKVMETVVRTHGFDGIESEFVPVQPGDVPTAMPHIEHRHPA